MIRNKTVSRVQFTSSIVFSHLLAYPIRGWTKNKNFIFRIIVPVRKWIWIIVTITQRVVCFRMYISCLLLHHIKPHRRINLAKNTPTFVARSLKPILSNKLYENTAVRWEITMSLLWFETLNASNLRTSFFHLRYALFFLISYNNFFKNYASCAAHLYISNTP